MILELSEKQDLARELLNDPQITEFYYGGAAGGGKTVFVCLWMLEQMRRYPGITIALGRKELTRLKQTTIKTLFKIGHPLMNINPDSFKYWDQKSLIEYRNGSSIQLLDLVKVPRDPDFDTLGSLDFTHAIIEEAGEIVKQAKTVLSSRTNRMLNDKYKITGKTILTGNPSQNFTYTDFYEPYRKRGMGDYQIWENGEVEVDGIIKQAKTAFVKSLVTDNPKVPMNYILKLNSLPPQEKKRLREGNWDYKDDDDILFKFELFERSMISELRTGMKFVGVDPSDKGKDNTSVSLIEDGILKEHKNLKIQSTPNSSISELYALELIKFLQQRDIKPNEAKQVAIEANGIGVGMRDFMRSKGWHITEYTSNKRLRDQNFYDMSQDLDKQDLMINSNLESLEELRKQLMVLTYDFDNDTQQPNVMSKKEWKEILGYSPDEADSANIANWLRRGGYQEKRVSRVIL